MAELATTIEELRQEGMVAALPEPASPYADQYSLAGVTVPDEEKILVEIVGPASTLATFYGPPPPDER